MFTLTPFNRANGFLSDTDDFYKTFFDAFRDAPRSASRLDTFRIDLKETEGGYAVEAELPGVRKEEVSINFNDGNLKIAVERSESGGGDDGNYIHRERRFASMSRTVYLPDASADGITAKLNDGVLAVTVAKTKKADTAVNITVG
ncbi:heat-shock protein Hsp20 [Clostridia bacterium]|nr:heat-shock protein Hsp20 [Clostridia bacterium]